MSVPFNTNSITTTTTNGLNALNHAHPRDSIAVPNQGKSMRSRITAVRVKAGYLGQVVVDDLTGTVLWESSPKKTLAKAEAAAKKAQLRAAQRSFE